MKTIHRQTYGDWKCYETKTEFICDTNYGDKPRPKTKRQTEKRYTNWISTSTTSGSQTKVGQLSWAFRRDWEMRKDKSLNATTDAQKQMPSWGTQFDMQEQHEQTNFIKRTAAKTTRSDSKAEVEADKRGTTTKSAQWWWRRRCELHLRAKKQMERWFGIEKVETTWEDGYSGKGHCTRDRTKMSTAPTTHDTPNENAHRMGA